MTRVPIRILVARGRAANPWDLRPWEALPEEFVTSFLRLRGNSYDTSSVRLRQETAWARSALVPGPKLVGDAITALIGDRHLGVDEALGQTDVVHAAELSYWFTADLARRKRHHSYSLVVTVWETIPMGHAFRNPSARRHRDLVLQEADLFVAATERAREGLLLEGVEEQRIQVSYPGVDVGRFTPGPSDPDAGHHTIVSPGRLVWEKGHQDVIRAVAALHKGIVTLPQSVQPPDLIVVGDGPERDRLQAHAAELGIGHAVQLRPFVPHEEMPALFSSASAMVLASLPYSGGGISPLGSPRGFWEEQFGMVLAEAMMAGLDIVAGSSGAIPEVMGGAGTLVMPGDWLGIARALADGALSRAPGERVAYPAPLLARYSADAAALRLADIYSGLASSKSRK